jgi:hypothetical protein
LLGVHPHHAENAPAALVATAAATVSASEIVTGMIVIVREIGTVTTKTRRRIRRRSDDTTMQ